MTADAGPARTLASAAVVGGAAALLLVPAAWNGSVLYYPDSVDYVHLPFSFDLPIYRTMPYGIFAGLARLTGTVWTPVAVQALAVAWSLREGLAVFLPGREARLLVPLTALLCLFTGLPWAVGGLMPDAFTGLAVMAVAVLAYGRNLSPLRRAVMAAILVVAVAVHTSHVALASGLVLCLFGLAGMARRWPMLPRPRIGWPAAAVVAGVTTIAGIHWVTAGRPFIVQPSNVLMLARLVQDGLAKQLLDEDCPARPDLYRLCAYRDKLPPTANAFLWSGDAIPPRLGGWEGLETEATTILHETWKRYPIRHLEVAARLTMQQLAGFSTGDGTVDIEWLIGEALGRYYPADATRYKASRQRKGIDFAPVNALQVPALALFQFLLPVALVVAWRRRRGEAAVFLVILVLAFLGNALVCGALSNPNDRYQSRLVWLAPFGLAIALARRSEEGRNPGPAP